MISLTKKALIAVRISYFKYELKVLFVVADTFPFGYTKEH